MTRWAGLGALLVLLSACVPQPPRQIVPQTAAVVRTAAFQPIPPAGFCLSDESDVLGTKLEQSLMRQAPRDGQVLGVFRPCGEPSLQKDVMMLNADRLIFMIEPSQPSRPDDAPIMDRQLFVTMMANPRVTALLSERSLPPVRSRSAGRPGEMTASDFRYLGADADAVYNGALISFSNPERQVKGDARFVMGQTIIDRTLMTVVCVDFAANRAPKDWKSIQDTVAQAVHGTIIAAERPSRTAPASPPLPPKPGAAGLST